MTHWKLSKSSHWLALVIGNSRLHWGYFQNNTLQNTWDTAHLSQPLIDKIIPADFLLPQIPNCLPLYIASVVPSQSKLWQTYPKGKIINLDEIPLKSLYSTLGIDRALAILGAGEIYNFPCLVIDAGTALTITGVDRDRTLVGGAILPGLMLQFQSLSVRTAALPYLNLPNRLPNRWVSNTDEAITSGILYTIIGGITTFIDDWLKTYPQSKIILTGGDSQTLFSYFQQQNYRTSENLKLNKNIIFWGIFFYIQHNITKV
ncbi:MAG: pantothenate kinase [Cyanobacteria bacterium P01_G01_bin.49]